MNKKITATILSVMFIMGLAVGVVPVRTAAFDIPTTPTAGIQNGTYLIQDYVCNRYFGFTTGQPICDRSPSMQNSEWSIGYAGNGKYSISYVNSRVYGFLNNINGTAVPAPNQQYWYIIKNDDGTYTFVPENDTSKALTTEIVTAINQVNVRVASSSSTGGTQKWNLKLIHNINVNTYFDKGFKIIYGSSNDNTSKSKTLDIVSQCEDLYLELFQLKHINSAAGYRASLCDICKGTVSANNINSPCPHTENHTYWENVAAHFADSETFSSYSQKGVLFVGNKTFYLDGNESGLSCSYGPTFGNRQGHMLIMKLYDPSEYVSKQGMVYAHELAHQYTAPDHYCAFDQNDTSTNRRCLNGDYCSHPEHTDSALPRRSEYCIMDNMKNEGTKIADYYKKSLSAWSNNYSVFCSYCQSDIRAGIIEYYDN